MIGTIKPGRPARLGVVMSNSLQGAEAGVRRQLTLEKSLVSSGGVLFDDARGADGTATTTVRSGITAYGNLVGSRVVGPVTYTYGQRGSITGSEITGALTLTDAETGPDPSNPALRAFSVGASSLTEPGERRPGYRARRRQLVGLRDRGLRHDVRPGRPRGRADDRSGAAERPGADARRRRRPARSSTRSARPSSRTARRSTRSWSRATTSA